MPRGHPLIRAFGGSPIQLLTSHCPGLCPLDTPQLQEILENQVFCFLTGQVGQTNETASAVVKKEVEWVWVEHLAVSAPQGDIRVQVILENQGPLQREKQ